MNKPITALLVDDEVSARENMRWLLEQYCPQVKIVAEATCVDEAVISILQYKPQVVFLDIDMPEKSGFELMHSFQSIDFQVIFVTSHDNYAVKAFEVSALDYLLKPVDPDRLQTAIDKIAGQRTENHQEKRFKALIENQNSAEVSRLAIPHKGDYDIVDLSSIVTIAADRMYSLIDVSGSETKPEKQYLYAKKLCHFEELLEEHPHFHRVHRSWMVNTRFVQSYSKKEHCLILKDKRSIPVSKSYRAQVQNLLGFTPVQSMLSLLGS